MTLFPFSKTFDMVKKSSNDQIAPRALKIRSKLPKEVPGKFENWRIRRNQIYNQNIENQGI